MALFDLFPEALAATFTSYLPRTATTHHYLENNLNNNINTISKPFVTLTYASSLDSQISLAPGVQTLLSGPLTKHFTHHLRSCHAAILVGVNTAIADDPGLNCRIRHIVQDAQPRPIILDPQARWLCSWLRYSLDSVKNQHQQQDEDEKYRKIHDSQNDKSKEFYSDIKNCRLFRTAREGKGLYPWVLVREHNSRLSMSQQDPDEYENMTKRRAVAEKAFIDAGGHIIYIPDLPAVDATTNPTTTLEFNGEEDNKENNKNDEGTNTDFARNKWSWSTILSKLANQGITSLMVEGGAGVINDLLSVGNLHLVNSVIITIAPVFLGQGGVVVSPPGRAGESSENGGVTRVTAVRFKDVGWCVMESDVVMVARPVV